MIASLLVITITTVIFKYFFAQVQLIYAMSSCFNSKHPEIKSLTNFAHTFFEVKNLLKFVESVT